MRHSQRWHRSRGHLARHALALLGVLLALAGFYTDVAAQEYRIFLIGKTEPIVASLYAEETPWVFFRDDQSMYVFAVGCNRIERVEQGGRALPPPACPVDRLPTTMPRVLIGIMDLEAKRLDDSISRLREQTRAYSQAVIGTFAATGDFTAADTGKRIEAETVRRRSLDAVAFLQNQISDTLFDIRLSEQRVGALLDQARSYPRPERSRYFFFAR